MGRQSVRYLILIMAFVSSCSSDKQTKDGLVYIDVSKNYPEKGIQLEDFADIEYVQLEFDEDFLFSEVPAIVTANYMIICRFIAGDILIFTRDGKPYTKFNHKGNGPGEYAYIEKLLYDEASDEFFVLSNNKLLVYSSSGAFRKVIPLRDGFSNMIPLGVIVNYDSISLLLYEQHNLYPTRFSLISKVDGSMVDSIQISKGEEIELYVLSQDKAFALLAPSYPMVKYKDGYLLTDFSIDTVFYLSGEKELSPILVRKPAIQSMDPVIYMNSFVEAGNYEFVSVITVTNENNRLPRTYLMRDRKTGSIYKQKITFNDYRGKEVYLSPETINNTQNSKSGLIVLGLAELQNANNENKLSGKLKELVDNSDEDGNDIYMLLHFK